MRLLLSSFEPFGGRQTNCSNQLMEAIVSRQSDLDSVVLPVSFDSAFRVLKKKIDECNPDLVVATGESASASSFQFECSALNLQSSETADNDGIRPVHETIDSKFGHGIFVSRDLQSIDRHINSLDGFQLSFFAGTYVCNRLFFDLLKWEKESGISTCFVHVPFIDGEGFTLESAVEKFSKFLEILEAA